jgi:succinyl-diaminopimelate desuccinylase
MAMPLVASDPVALTQALIRCPSVTPLEGGALSLLEEALRPLGFAVHRMTFSAPGTADVENLYARLGTQGPNLCFAGHTDVVPPGDESRWKLPPFGAQIRDGVLYGRGAVDMKGAIACFIAAVARLAAKPGGLTGGSISLLITGDEEGPGINGTLRVLDWLKERGERLDACVVGEPSNPVALGDEIKIGRRGSLNAWLTVKGRQGHVAYPQLGSNPITGLVDVLQALATDRLDEGTAEFARSNLEVTTVDVGNGTVNIIPAEAKARLNIRYNDRHSGASLEARLAANSARVLAAPKFEGKLEHAWTFLRSGDAFLTQPGPLVETMSAAVRDVTGRIAALTTSGGTSDARFIKDACPVIEMGLVNATIHQVDEHVAVADLAKLTNIYERFITGYFAQVRA